MEHSFDVDVGYCYCTDSMPFCPFFGFSNLNLCSVDIYLYIYICCTSLMKSFISSFVVMDANLWNFLCLLMVYSAGICFRQYCWWMTTSITIYSSLSPSVLFSIGCVVCVRACLFLCVPHIGYGCFCFPSFCFRRNN